MAKELRDELLDHYSGIADGVLVSHESGLKVGQLRELLQAHEELETAVDLLNKLIGVRDVLDDALRIVQERARWRTDVLRELVSSVMGDALEVSARAALTRAGAGTSAREGDGE